jgi:hypothetical protein
MIQAVIDKLTTKVSVLNFIERYGGLVQTAVKIGQTDEGAFYEQRFPIACGVSSRECWEKGKFLQLVPNDTYKSVFYFEQLEDLNFEDGFYKDKVIQLRTTLRAVCWLNLAKLGLMDNCTISDQVAALLIDALSVKSEALDAPWDKASYQLEPLQVVQKTPEIFERYTYADYNFTLYPYDYCAIDFELNVFVNTACIDDLTLGSEVECIDLTQN